MTTLTPTKLDVVTTTISGSEKAYSLAELNEQSPRNRGFHRYQIIQVIRGDNIATYREDMGSVKKFKGVKQFRIPALFLHTVDELKDIAVGLRNETDIDVKELLQLDKINLA